MTDINSFGNRFVKLAGEQLAGISRMNMFLMTAAVIVLVHTICLIYRRIRKSDIGAGREILFMCLAAYAVFIFQITFFNREEGSRGGVFTALSQWIFRGEWLISNQFIYDVLNLGLFIPWGFLLTLVRGGDMFFPCVLMVSCYCFLTSFMIEALQLMTGRGYFEVMDIIMNVLGGIVGCLLGRMMRQDNLHSQKRLRNGDSYGQENEER